MEETKEEQENSIENFWKKGNQQFTEDGRTAEITVELVLQASAKMSENKVNGPEDVILSEMIKRLPMEKIFTVTRCFQERFVGMMESPNSWKVVNLVFLRKPDAAPTKEVRSYRAIALTSVMLKCYASCILLRLEKETGARKMEEATYWWIGWNKLPRLASGDAECDTETLGVAGGKESCDETWDGGKTNTVSTWRRSWTVTIHTDGSLRPSCVRCRDCLARPCLNAWKSSFRQGRVEAPRLWQKMANEILTNVEEEWMK